MALNINALAASILTNEGYHAVFKPTDMPGCEDDEIEIANPDKDWTLGIQISPGGRDCCLNRYTEEPFTMQILGEYPNVMAAVTEALGVLRAG